MFSKRIETLSKKIRPYKVFADVGCDHGYLMIESILYNNVDFAYGVDNKKGPLTSALNNLNRYSIPDNKYNLSLSSGLVSLGDDVKCVVIAGMGTDNIKMIIDASLEKTQTIERFIIDSHRNLKELRSYMANLNYKIIDEEVIFEENIYYEIMVFEKTNQCLDYSELELEFGPILIKKKDHLFIQKWESEITKLQRIYDECRNAKIEEKIERIKMVL